MGECDITNLENDLRGIVAEIVEMEPDEVKLEADFVEDFEMDSMQALEIMAAIEKKYKIQIPEDYLGKVTKLSNLIKITEETVNAK
ncbi:MAG: acyl carrier protein [Candidatus Omnitrophica bacterium]|nr:acyl carrier protein [Candidatus Omnitrophota bacterium]